jgi:predicted glycosyltransferase
LKKNKSVIIFVPLGNSLGHLSRNVALAKEIEQRRKDVKTVFAAGGLTYEAARKWRLDVVKVPEDASQELLDRWFDATSEGKHNSPSGIFIALSVSFFINSFLRWIRLWRWVRNIHPNLMVADGQYLMLGFCRVHKIPCVFVSNDLMPTVPRQIGEEAAKKIQSLLDKVITRFFRWANIIIVPDRPGITRVPIGLDVEFTGPILKIKKKDIPERKIVRRNMKVKPDDRLILVNVSGTGAGKELIYVAVEAFKIVRESNPTARMVIKYWPAILDEEATKLEAPGLKLKRFVPDLFEYILASDILVTHTGHTTIMEAALAGTPIITTPYVGQVEQMINAEKMATSGRALVIHPDDLDAKTLASNINFLLTNSERRLEMIVSNKKFVEGDGVSKASDRIIDILKRQ